MGDTDKQDRAKKSTLEAEKLALEKLLLQRQLSLQGILVAWLQGASVPVALVGAILAFFVGFGQLRQGAQSQAIDRFDKSLTRLASPSSDERMTGVAGLQLFLVGSDNLLQKEALQFLVNALSMETDKRVRGAILDVLADLPPRGLSQDALDGALRTAVERNRSLTKSIIDASSGRSVERKKQILTRLKIPGFDAQAITNQIPAQLVAALTTEQYLMLLDAEYMPFDGLDASDDLPLSSLQSAIQTLVSHGATSTDFRQINCENCDFSKSRPLDNAMFDGAHLAGANFSHLSLTGTSFINADLGGTNFFGADLTSADLHRSPYSAHGFLGKGLFYQLPLLECAKLGGANLSGQPLLLFVKDLSLAYYGGIS